MRVLVLGGAGRVAGYMLREATAAGHEVVAAARTPSKIKFEHERLRTVKCDLNDAAGLDAVVGEAKPDVIFMLAGHAAGNKVDAMGTWIRSIVESMRRHRVPRLIFLAGILVTRPGEGMPRLNRVIKCLALCCWRPAKTFFASALAGFDYLEREAQDVDWTVLRPGFIQDGPSKVADVKELYAGPTKDAGFGVQAVDLCRWMLEYSAPGGPYRHQLPNVSYKKKRA